MSRSTEWWSNGEGKGEGAVPYRTAAQMARANGPCRTFSRSCSSAADLDVRRLSQRQRRAVAATNPRFRLSLCDLDRAATPRQCCTFATWVRLAKMAGRPPGSRRKKTRRGVPPGHDLVFLDCAGSIQDSGNTCQVINRRTRASRATSRPSCVQRPLRPSHRSALMIERRKIYRARSVVRPLPSDSCSPPSNPRPAC